jgi:nucleoside-diphosphate-sugar epimerase
MSNEKQRIAITGGAGFLGAHTTKKLLDMGYDVTVLDFFHQYIFPVADSFLENVQYRFQSLLKGAQIMRANVNNKEDLRRKIQKIQPHYIIHLAALPLANVALWQTEEAFESIVGATFNIVDLMAELPSLKKFTYVSSSMIFGDFQQIPMPETGQKDPKDIYGGMKYAGEILTRVFSKKTKIPFAIIRPSAVYGPTDNNRRVLQIFVENAITEKPLEVTNPDATFLDFTFVEDTAQGIALAAVNDNVVNEDFNITRGEGRSLSHAINILRQRFPHLTVKEKGDSEKFRPNRGALDVKKAINLLGYNPQFSLEKGLNTYVDFVIATNKSLFKKT